MPASSKMSVEQSHLAMPPSVWLHINGVSLTTDVHPYQPPTHAYDYRTKHLQSPVQSPTPQLLSSQTFIPCTITTIDGPYSSNINKQYQKLENVDMPKKLFMDRQIRKAKSLPGLIKGTALSRHTPFNQSSTFSSPAPPNPITNHIQDDQLPNVTIYNDDSVVPLHQAIQHNTEIRRPRVYFADFNRVQFIEDKNEISQQQKQQQPAPPQQQQQHHTINNYKLRRHRHRASKKGSTTNGTNYVSPSIQQSQKLNNRSQPPPHQSYHQIGQELSIKKQQLLVSHRSFSSHATHLPDILNQSLPIEPSLNENSNGKYLLQREKPLIHIPKPLHDIPINSSMGISSEHTHNNINRSSSMQDSHNQTHELETNDNNNNGILLLASSSMSSTTTTTAASAANRQRSLLHTISLRQQFNSPMKIKSIGIPPTTTNNNNNYQQQQQQQMTNSKINTHRSTSLKYSNLKNHDENDDLNLNKSLSTTENRPMTALGPAKPLKRSDAIHLHSKHPFGGNTTNDLNETNRHLNRSNLNESDETRFQNLLTIVRPPYASSNGNSANLQTSIIPNDSARHTINHNHTKSTIRSSRSTSARGQLGFHITSNTIIV